MLSNAIVEAAEPRKRPYKMGDRNSMYLHVSPTGTKSFRYKYRLSGKEQLLTLGTYPEISVETARARLDQSRTRLAIGSLPPRWSSAPSERVPCDLRSLRVPPGSVVYFILCRNRHVKIGITRSLRARLAELQIGNPEPLTVLASVPGGRMHERELHCRFADDRRAGEWFRLSSRLKSFIAEIVKVGGWSC